ncbi:aminopeptidase N [Vibrio sp. 10N.261.46.E12]|uniref:aminopeptidase N n=1 Tax=unclassified Vibrio TaxID=2614977 RepID=UPI00097567BE|nr:MULTISPECIES: aminopeptidase N [unclassified Vibrio]OMO37083.1 aminopeptidase N [Vibrio sp. 10N.261.45.E1]PMJ36770.1 aminopeptidase N [Vibrio sp. 10N.286.45.B6]PML96584.1 aminopeptidase N [Vibrio sp. 10N.261.49.E11]PMM67205.1 aminopeptidase N [Vibrio sp. 10N.261.46.F12]PMM83625.1 aminopeptidase N [Vibrio sp. 10N.261.46.E8]
MAHTPQAKYRKDYQSPSHTISEIDLTFDLYDSASIITAVSSVKQEKDSATLVLDGEGLKLVSVLVEGKEWTQYEQSETQLTLNDLPNEFTLTIVTEVNPEGNSALEGLYKSGGAFCTQCEAEGFRRITYYMDRPDVLAKFTTTVIADKAENPFLLSNGNRVDEGEAENGRHWVKWQDPHPKPAYLFALVAGDFDVLRDAYITQSGRKVDLEIFVDKGNLDRANHAMVSLINSMKWDEERFNLEYDLDIYMIVAVDFFNMGAMENKGLNVFNSKFVLANDQTATDTDYLGIEAVIGHEYFHNWTGNRVTCRDWFQLSLKEGLTVFRDQEFSSDLGSRAVNRINNVRIIRGPQFAEDASPMSHPIRPEKVIEMNNFYTLTVYEKGSEVIRMIHTLLGEDGFQKGMKLYFERHDGTAATCEDFVAAMEDASGVDLSQFRLWYSQSGTPTLSVESHYDAEKKEYTLTTYQVTAPTHEQTEKQALHIPLDIELYTAAGEVVELQCNGKPVHNVLDVKEAVQTFVFENVSEQPIPSLLREFSAPVKLEYDYSDEELIFLMVNARNEFSRWDAGQMLLAKYIRSNIEKVKQGEAFELSASVVDAFRGVLLSDSLEPAFIAEMLSLPSHNEVSGWYERVDIDAAASVLNSMKVTLATELEDELAAVYHSHVLTEYTIDHDSIGKRTLRKVCLSYLAHTDQGNDLVVAMYQQANNMTDTMAAMGAANSAQLACRETLMADYSDKWKHDGLVMDKWFALQGTNPSSNALEVIKESMSHQAFSLKNPNRTRNLVGSFLNMNPVQFHDKSGKGYAFAGEILRELNSSNPQVASRLIDPLLKFRKYDDERQALIKQELETLKNMDNLAKDLFEKVTKALEA